MLVIKALEGGYGTAQVLFGIELSAGTGEVVCLLGRNGMGKTTTIKTMMGLLPAWGGEISFDGHTLTGRSASQIARLGIGLVPEGRQIFPNLTVHENLLVAATARAGPAQPWTADRIYEMFPSLFERRSYAGNLLSGGEQQMLAIGRALMTNPKLLVLDEATEGLAPVIRDQIWTCLQMLRGLGLSILVIDKHLKRLSALGDRFYVVDKGRIVWSGSTLDPQTGALLTKYISV